VSAAGISVDQKQRHRYENSSNRNERYTHGVGISPFRACPARTQLCRLLERGELFCFDIDGKHHPGLAIRTVSVESVDWVRLHGKNVSPDRLVGGEGMRTSLTRIENLRNLRNSPAARSLSVNLRGVSIKHVYEASHRRTRQTGNQWSRRP
jgi:hypothetical protein